ncbi:hypothetical protein AUJ66_08135 [Candidatus Desantisbacteria bacterium CG1_02_38_46]|uniref:Putative 3-methyladenine DNA glycosylase n=3 Tax=unclassified Candidatus Desantisiibacteriota TaxID=3106372 RepID=A0A2H9PCN5_9BACT|nr:MAG: hypothetical protein AUJ66_08135 [Candidatus Desantisbacteria bacterium CG1_02_38_46]PIU51467.1 MAG: DNA-3-methyladenine glycosylase [Candidatus Desantisbacteria bacterium CG07_land_8_20_14_0_80_39_15]PIZ17067.1 MAG: DNA-3-methyladenine glycosylase [Candidatus Desantisbacteria bacterium CG_4_10_14_0_8_um_filter_39_17]
MISKRLSRNFWTRPTLKVAKDLLGKFIVRQIGKRKSKGMIVETEAYIGPEDKASHAYGGKVTKRNRAEYLIGGHIYIYLVYGMYWQLNISTGDEGKPECVLLRAIEPANERERKNSNLRVVPNGPGKLCQYLKLDKSFYGEDVTKSKRLWLADNDIKIKKLEIAVGTRIGIDYAGEWAKKPWRFYIKGNPFVSKR